MCQVIFSKNIGRAVVQPNWRIFFPPRSGVNIETKSLKPPRHSTYLTASLSIGFPIFFEQFHDPKVNPAALYDSSKR